MHLPVAAIHLSEVVAPPDSGEVASQLALIGASSRANSAVHQAIAMAAAQAAW